MSGIPAFPSLRTTAPEQIDRSVTCLQLNPLTTTPLTRLEAQMTPTLGDSSSASILQSPRVDKLLASLFCNSTYDIRIVEPPDPEVNPERHLLTPPSKGGLEAECADLCQQGEEFVKQCRYEEARECFLSYLAKEPGSSTTLYRMACLEANAGRLDEARKWGEEALDHDPLRSEVHYTLALIHEMQGDLQEAINRLKKVIYLDPHFILAHFGLFHIYQRTGHPIEAERHRTLAVHLASKLTPDAVLPGSDDLTAGQLLTMARTVKHNRS